jgi:hypothetical protein
VDIEGGVALDQELDDVIDELKADRRRAEARVALRLGGAEVDRHRRPGRRLPRSPRASRPAALDREGNPYVEAD